MKIIDRIIIDNKAPNNKNVIWIDISNTEPVQRYYWNGEWKPISKNNGDDGDYDNLANKPSINNITLTGNKTTAQLGLQETLTIDATPTEDSTNPVQSGGVYEALEDKLDKEELYIRLGFPVFDASLYYSQGDLVVYNGDLYVFTAAHHGQWDADDVEPHDIYKELKDLYVDLAEQIDAKQDTISDLATIRSGAAAGATAYQKPSGGIPKTDLASGVQTSLGKADTSIQNLSTPLSPDGTITATKANGDTIIIDLNHQHPNYYSKVAETTQPSGGMLPDVTYKLGTLTGATTFSFAAAVSGNVNHYYFTFTSGSTAVVPTWPAAITSWDGNCVDSNTGLPVIAASKTYEVSVLDGNAIIKEW